ncbi:topology modulation protein [Actinopolymorpha rutila]|uniref:Adenylate kinase family enzyme n=1 Tax=Actinopolymorpha rutila TaxID=446787 RepID=A0A852ZBW1_9ACTN|nr:topology modulation protein [Actinopolymorpha rutila]NYH89675.1 adenylate kinase family enzyme [Actinopolymorpha rutila]
MIGCGGSGKSHVARQLGQSLGVPVTHLDAVYYDDAWNQLPMDEFEAAQRELVRLPTWVIDGNYNTTLHVRLRACDTVIFMDLPTRECLWGVLARRAANGHGQNRTHGVFNRVDLGFLRYVATYRRKMRPRVLQKLDDLAGNADIVRLTSRRQVRRWLATTARHSEPCR